MEKYRKKVIGTGIHELCPHIFISAITGQRVDDYLSYRLR